MCSMAGVYSWGSTLNGELGVYDKDDGRIPHPELNQAITKLDIKKVCTGLTHTLLLSVNGLLYSCGNNDKGQLGYKSKSGQIALIESLQNYTIEDISVGDQHSLAVTSWGQVCSWGDNACGQLGLGPSELQSDVPKVIKSLSHKYIVQVACGANHSMILTTDTEVYAWGMNNHGQLGLGHGSCPVPTPQRISLIIGVPIKLITAGGYHSCALSYGGYLLCWGSNKYGQLGRSNDTDLFCPTPKCVPNLASYSEQLTHVGAGENFTVVLDSIGKLWTFGNGSDGQLGHGSFENSYIPRPVLDLLGTHVSRVVCGRCHTLVLLSNHEIYGFGQGQHGQLGVDLGVDQSGNFHIPQRIPGPWEELKHHSLSELDVEIFAGGDTSSVLLVLPSAVSLQLEHKLPLQVDPQKVDQLLLLGEDEQISDDMFSYVEVVFSSLGCWNNSFFTNECSKDIHNVNYRLAQETIEKIGRFQREVLEQMVTSGLSSVINAIPSVPATPDALRYVVILPLHKEFMCEKHCYDIQIPYARSIINLADELLAMIMKWLGTLPTDFTVHLVHIYKRVLVFLLKSRTMPLLTNNPASGLQDNVSCVLQFLEVLYVQNKNMVLKQVKIPYEEFYVSDIAHLIDLKSDYALWLGLQKKFTSRKESFCFCQYSFVFDSEAKALLLKIDATHQMRGAMMEAVQHANIFQVFLDPSGVTHINLHVRRDNLVQDALNQLNPYTTDSLKKPLKVHFVGEEAEDEGGVRKEFFLLLVRELLNPDFGMFKEFPETRYMWFREETLETDHAYKLVGLVCGLGIYNYTIINVPFPLALYKKLLGEPVDIDDLLEMDPVFGKNLYRLLEYDDDDFESVFCMDFTVTVEHFGEVKCIELKENGRNCPVTKENRAEFVDLVVDWHLKKGIERQYLAFHEGFHQVCGGGLLKLFHPEELMTLVTGSENYVWTELQRNTVYKGEYHPNHTSIQIFWSVFFDLSLEQKRKFLLFLTGSDRVPLLGMKEIKMVIQSVPDGNHLPVAHTCVSQLDLPSYQTKEKLRYKLCQAIQQSEGFGLV